MNALDNLKMLMAERAEMAAVPRTFGDTAYNIFPLVSAALSALPALIAAAEAAKDYLEMQGANRRGVTIRDWTEREERLRIALAQLEEEHCGATDTDAMKKAKCPHAEPSPMRDKPLSAAQAVARIRLRVNTNWNSREAAMCALAEVAGCIEPLAAIEAQLARCTDECNRNGLALAEALIELATMRETAYGTPSLAAAFDVMRSVADAIGDRTHGAMMSECHEWRDRLRKAAGG